MGLACCVIFLFLSCLGHVHGLQYTDAEQAIIDLIKRNAQNDTIANMFAVKITVKTTPDEKPWFALYPFSSSSSSSLDVAAVILIEGNSGVSVASGFNWYAKYFCNVSVLSWSSRPSSSSSLSWPSPLPLPPTAGTLIYSPLTYSYYMNVCTVSYSMAYWDWKRWQQELDWMALQGINLALAFTGQEKIWRRVWTSFGLSDVELDAFFAGPGFLAWQRMGNIQGWPSSVPLSFFDAQFDLQLQIIARMRLFSITPVLPAFSGFVPSGLSRLYPNSSISVTSAWNGFLSPYCCTSLLSPDDPLFVEVGKTFLTVQKEMLFGGEGEEQTTHIYNTDTFNENTPPNSDPQYLAQLSLKVYQSMQAADSEAIWLMQGWLFHNDPNFWQPAQVAALLGSVPNDRMIILDLFSDVYPVWQNFDRYYGKPFIWCTLHNFGGQIGMYGRLDYLLSGSQSALNNASSSSMIGVGITMEGIFQNEIVYELATELMWQLTEPKTTTTTRTTTKTTTTMKAVTTAESAKEIERATNKKTMKRTTENEEEEGSEESVSASDWLQSYVVRRYGPLQDLDRMQNAWKALHQSVYTCENGQSGVTRAAWEVRPSLTLSSGSFQPVVPFYDPNLVLSALDDFITAASAWPRSNSAVPDAFLYDMIDVLRQSLSFTFYDAHTTLSTAYNSNQSLSVVSSIGARMINIISDVDRLLNTDDRWMLGPWIQAARQQAQAKDEQTDADSDDADYYEFNVRNQITLWGPHGEIRDYAGKSWGGLLGSYYHTRWSLFKDRIDQSVVSGVPFSQSSFDIDCLNFELSWQQLTSSTQPFPVVATEDTMTVVRELYQKYYMNRKLKR